MDVNEFLKETLSGCSRKDLAIEADLAEASLSRFLNGKQKLLGKNLIKLSEAAAMLSGENPQLMLCQLAELYNDAYWQITKKPALDYKNYTNTELEGFLDTMLHRRTISPSINYLRCIKDIENLLAWARQDKLSPDFDLPFNLQAAFKGKVNATVLKAGTEFRLYEPLRDLFVEIRHPLQLVGDIDLRIYLAKWLESEAKSRNEPATVILALSSLAWSYTSSTGGRDNLKLAQQFSIAAFELYTAVHKEIQLAPSIAIELYENMARIATRAGEFEAARRHIQTGFRFVEEHRCSVGGRLYTRFRTTFLYHQGIVFYKCHMYEDAAKTFSEVAFNAELIGWERVHEGAISWQATIATALEQYKYSIELTTPFWGLSLEECETYTERNPVCRSKRTVQCLMSAAHTFCALGENNTANTLREKASIILINLR